MFKKAIILDLDNTIYPVSSIGDKLFSPLFKLIIENGQYASDLHLIQDDIMRKPFQVVASIHQFSDELTQKGIELLTNIIYEGSMEPFNDYIIIKDLPVEKFLVTTGFLNLQKSKIKQLGIEGDFKEINIVDPATSDKTKRDVFADLIRRYNYDIKEVLVIGDDLQSEIKAAQELGIDTVLYDKFNLHNSNNAHQRIVDFSELKYFINH